MKKVSKLKVGDVAIYISGDNVKVSKVVSKPIFDGKLRPIFKIGRTDLANGDYLINGGDVYDTLDEATDALIKKIKNTIESYKEQKFLAEKMIDLYEQKLESLQS